MKVNEYGPTGRYHQMDSIIELDQIAKYAGSEIIQPPVVEDGTRVESVFSILRPEGSMRRVGDETTCTHNHTQAVSDHHHFGGL